MLRFFLGSFSFVLSLLVLFGAPDAAFSQAAPDCSNEKSLKSPPSATQSELSFQNRSAEKRRIYWIDQEGDRRFYGIVEPGNVFKQPTLENHAWVVTDDAEKCLYTFVAAAEPRTVSVGEAAAAAIAPPPAGGQQPIAQAAPPPPAVVQAPPPVVQAPQPVAAAPPLAAQQDPQTAMAEVPRISPVEQFDLRGVFRISPRTNPSIAINSEAAGTIFVMNVKPEWTSGQWAFEAVPGLPFVRIRNEWKKTYLTDVGGKLRATAATPDADEAHWTFEPVDGTPFVQFRNRETDRFLIVVGGAPVLADGLRQDQENLSEWKVGPAGRAAVAAAPPPPRNSAYDAALANCRELGGYWTGSSCRAAIASRPLICPRGYAWSEDVGECQWDGGSCPPWQMGPGGVCMTDLACRGGVVRISRRGYPACYCPFGYVAWGDYPRLSCVPSVARIAPLLIGGAAIAILGANQGRPTIGQVYGNKRFCPPGKTGTPPNCVVAATCQAPLVGTPPNCLRLVPRPTVPVVLTPTQPTTPPPPTLPPPVVGGGGTGTCLAGQTGTPPNCVPIKVVRDPPPTTPQIGPAITTTIDPATGIQTTKTTGPTGVVTTQQTCAPGFTGTPPNCKSTAVATPTTGPRACNVGEVPQAANCLCKDPLFIFDGKCAQQTLAKPTAPTSRACNVGEVPQAAGCQCKEPLFIFDGKCAQQTLAKPTAPTTRACNVGEVPQAAGCQCKEPLFIFDNKCAQQTIAKPTARTCSSGERPQATNCLCKAPLQVAANGACSPPSNIRLAPAPPPAQCPTGQVGTPPNNCKAVQQPQVQPKPTVTPPPPPKTTVTPPPPPKTTVTAPPPPKPTVTAPPPPKPVTPPPPCAPPKKLNAAGQCL